MAVVVEQHGGNNTDWSRMQARIGSAESRATYFPNANRWESGNAVSPPPPPGVGTWSLPVGETAAESLKTSSLVQDAVDVVVDGGSLSFPKPTSKKPVSAVAAGRN